jgi:hypothetical protein
MSQLHNATPVGGSHIRHVDGSKSLDMVRTTVLLAIVHRMSAARGSFQSTKELESFLIR